MFNFQPPNPTDVKWLFKNTNELDTLVIKFKELGYNSRWASKKKRDIILEK